MGEGGTHARVNLLPNGPGARDGNEDRAGDEIAHRLHLQWRSENGDVVPS